MSRQPIIAVIGGYKTDDEKFEIAKKLGMNIAGSKAMLLCSGSNGITEAVCEGAKSNKGTTIGVVPGIETSQAHPAIDIPIVTAMKEDHKKIIARTADVVIAIEDSSPALNEVTETLKVGTPVVSLFKSEPRENDTFDSNLFFKAQSPEEAVDTALNIFNVISKIEPKEE